MCQLQILSLFVDLEEHVDFEMEVPEVEVVNNPEPNVAEPDIANEPTSQPATLI